MRDILRQDRLPTFSIVGLLVVFGRVIAVFLMNKGKLPVPIQPSELVAAIGLVAIGTVLAATLNRLADW